MKKIITIIGARPQFIKHAPVEKIIKKYAENIVIHTGQHFDKNMTDIFFTQLGIDKPSYNLGIHGGNHGSMTGKMLEKIEDIVLKEKPNLIVVYGDTNSTLAGSLVGSKLHIPIIHIEAGLRSGDKKMPEEINRIMTDHVSEYLFCPTSTAINNLKIEGITKGVFRVHDPMYVTVNFFKDQAEKINIIDKLGLKKGEYFFMTMHRPSNTDSKEQLQSILNLINGLSKKIIFPLHPRTKQKIKDFGLTYGKNIYMIEPCGYIETLNYILNSDGVLTDSGGLQKEAYILNKNIFTLRDTTEWIETVNSGKNTLLLDKSGDLLSNSKELIENYRGGEYSNHYGMGESLEKLFKKILN